MLREKLKSFGRDTAKFRIEAWLRMRDPDPQGWAAAADGWRRLGADMVMLYPMYRSCRKFAFAAPIALAGSAPAAAERYPESVPSP